MRDSLRHAWGPVQSGLGCGSAEHPAASHLIYHPLGCLLLLVALSLAPRRRPAGWPRRSFCLLFLPEGLASLIEMLEPIAPALPQLLEAAGRGCGLQRSEGRR